MWIYLYERKYGNAKALALEVAERFPRDTMSRWVLGRVALADGECAQAGKRFGEVEKINSLLNLPASDYQDVDTGIKKAEICAMMKNREYGKARELNRQILAWLKSHPKITLEYQDEKNLVKFWLEESLELDKKLADKASSN